MSTVLIADDSKFMRNYIKNMLRSHGYDDILEAADGREAMDLYRQKRPDIVLLDITMPHVDGLTALKGILEYDPEAKVVMCSAISTESNVIEALRTGAKDFISKPNFDGLIDILDKIGP